MGEAKYVVGIGLAGDVEKLERGLGQAMTRIGLVRYRPEMQQHHEPPLGSQHARHLRVGIAHERVVARAGLSRDATK